MNAVPGSSLMEGSVGALTSDWRRVEGRRRSLHRRIRLERLAAASTTTEIAWVISVTMFLTVWTLQYGSTLDLPSWSWLATVAGGLVFAALLLLTALRDPAVIEATLPAALQKVLRSELISDSAVAEQLLQAIAHRTDIEIGFVNARARMRWHNRTLLAEVDDWLCGIGELAHLVSRLKTNALSTADLRNNLASRIRILELRKGSADDARMQRQIDQTIAGRKRQLQMVTALAQQAETGLLRLEQAVAALATVRTQLTLADAWRDSAPFDDLSGDINRNIEEIASVLKALETGNGDGVD
jgi:hypothetical protein